MRYLKIIICFFIVAFQSCYGTTAFIDVPAQHTRLLQYTLDDVTSLFRQGNCRITDTLSASVNWKIELKLQTDTSHYQTFYDSNTKQTQGFSIHSYMEGKMHLISIASRSEKGLSNGMYYWLQNYLGFSFYHPKETIIPDLGKVIPGTFSVSVMPRFDKLGFHIHSQHPLELTEALLNENTPNGNDEVETYINWLCRNGQNYFEFCLLRSVDLPAWVPYIKPVIEYAHSRGIICGLDLSFHMIQQRAFQLYANFPSSFKSKDKQISANIEKLMKINWDVWNVEFASNEFAEKNQQKLYLQKKFLYDALQPYKVKLVTRKHVVKDENLLSNEKSYKKDRTDMDSAYGLFVHSVFFYSLNDSSAPVYRNKDFSHIRKLLLESKQYRDTWYFPESAYWITFDSSIPMFLTSYLDARLEDIIYCDSVGIDGHITFSSGWEWNYWLVDWSIAQWCWKTSDTSEIPSSMQYFGKAVKDTSLVDFVKKAADLQNTWIKEKEMIKVMDAQTITDEIGGKLNIEFHPRPEYPYKYIMNEATAEELGFIRKKYITGLSDFVDAYNKLRARYKFTSTGKIENEMLRSLDVVAMRAEHRKNTLEYLVGYRLNKINNTKIPVQQYLDTAQSIRKSALVFVKQQENNYRYPASDIAVKKESMTVYNFGYLYTASNLHFWEREEMQAKNNKWKFWYLSIWDVLKIIGVKK